MPLRQLLLPFLLLALTTSLAAQPTLTGRLTDAATGEPVDFATVYLSGSSGGDVSDDDGRFSFRVPAGMGQSILVVSHLNYETPVAAPCRQPHHLRPHAYRQGR